MSFLIRLASSFTARLHNIKRGQFITIGSPVRGPHHDECAFIMYGLFMMIIKSSNMAVHV